MTPTQAAKIIGCSPQQVRTLCRKGVIKASRIRIPWSGGHYYDITEKEARRYRDEPINQGFPRGKKRKGAKK